MWSFGRKRVYIGFWIWGVLMGYLLMEKRLLSMNWKVVIVFKLVVWLCCLFGLILN